MAQINSSLLVLATIAIIIPAAFHFAVSGQLANAAERSAILHMSHAVCISSFAHEIYSKCLHLIFIGCYHPHFACVTRFYYSPESV